MESAALLALVAYFVPTIVAGARRHHNQGAIFALNLLLGWTVIGWIAALVWALTAVTPRPAPVPRRLNRDPLGIWRKPTRPPADHHPG